MSYGPELKQEISLFHNENKNLEKRISDIEEESESESEDETDFDNVQEKNICKFKCKHKTCCQCKTRTSIM